MAVYAPMTTILKRTGYDVISLKRELDCAAERMSRALAEGIGATRDPHRDGFYDVELDGISYYVTPVPWARLPEQDSSILVGSNSHKSNAVALVSR